VRARSTIALAAVLAACAAPPPAPPPAPKAPERFAPKLAWEGKTPKLVARDPHGKVVWSIDGAHLSHPSAAPDGGAYVLREDKGTALVRLGPAGEELWSTPVKVGNRVELLATEAAVFVDDTAEYQGSYALRRALDGSLVRVTRARQVVAHPGGGAVALGEAVERLSAEGDVVWSVPVHGFPTADPAARPAAPLHVAVPLSSGDVVVGFADGALLGLDPGGHPRFQTSLRGAVWQMEVRRSGEIVVITDRGVVADLAPSGELLWEHHVVSGALSMPTLFSDGELAVLSADAALHLFARHGAPLGHAPLAYQPSTGGRASIRRAGERVIVANHRGIAEVSLGAPLVVPLAVTPTSAYRVEPVTLPVAGPVSSVVALGPGDVWALAGGLRLRGSQEQPSLVHLDGRRWEKLGPIKHAFAKEIFQGGAALDGHPAQPEKGEFNVRMLARSPRGTLLALGARDVDLWGGGDAPDDVSNLRAPCVLERRGGAFQERRELFESFRGVTRGWSTGARPLRYAVSAGGVERICVSDACVRVAPSGAAERVPMPHGVRALGYAGETLWTSGTRSEQDRGLRRGDQLMLDGLPVAEKIWASGERDVWALAETGSQRTLLYHHDGEKLTAWQAPLDELSELWGTGPDDVWAVGRYGAVRFDGRRWERVVGLPGELVSISGSSRGDVWIGSNTGLWHVTPAASVESTVEVTVALPRATTAPIAELAVAGVDAAYRLERASWPIDGAPALRSALSVATARGALWFADAQRIVEVAGGAARVIHEGERGCVRCAAPLLAGEGALLGRDLIALRGGKPTPAPTGIPELRALAVTPSGRLWLVAASGDDGLPHVALRTERGLRLFPGVPAASYLDVAVRAEDDVWIAGSMGPASDEGAATGEGVLLHFDGRAFTRHRGPGGALLAVAPAGPGEAWAVGAAGSVVHASAAGTTAYRVGGVPVLRAVAAAAPDDVWIAGSGGTLLRFDGRTLRRVDTAAAGRDAAFTAIVPPGKEPGWVVGPAGIFRVVAAR
jgi:hypothetical protein